MVDKITGPYKRVQIEPVCEADWHTGCVWPRRQGGAGIVDWSNSSYSRDGLHFELGAKTSLSDAGVFCPDAFGDTRYREGIRWGLAIQQQGGTLRINRFDADVRAPMGNGESGDGPPNTKATNK